MSAGPILIFDKSLIEMLSPDGRAMFTNIALVAPDAVLSALETALADADQGALRKCAHFVRLLRSDCRRPDLWNKRCAKKGGSPVWTTFRNGLSLGLQLAQMHENRR
jgi:hypothetical protein